MLYQFEPVPRRFKRVCHFEGRIRMSFTENEYESLDVKAQLYIKDQRQGETAILIQDK